MSRPSSAYIPSGGGGGLIKAMPPPPARPASTMLASPPSSAGKASSSLSPVTSPVASPKTERRSTFGVVGSSSSELKLDKGKATRQVQLQADNSGAKEASPAPAETEPVASAKETGTKREPPPVPTRKGTLRTMLKRKSSLGGNSAAVSKEAKDKEKEQAPMQIGGVIEGSFQHHAHVSQTEAAGSEEVDEMMLKSINTALEAMGASSLTAEEAKLILSSGSGSLAKIAQQLQQEAETRREVSRRARAPRQAQGAPPSHSSSLIAQNSASIAPSRTKVEQASSAPYTSVTAAIKASAPPTQTAAASKSDNSSSHSVRRKMLQVQQTLQEANARLLREVEDLKLAKYALENENKNLKKELSSVPASSGPAPGGSPNPQIKNGPGHRSSGGGMVVDFRTQQQVDKLKKDLDAEWKRAQQLTYNVIELEEKRQQIEYEKIRLAEEKHTLEDELAKLRDNSEREAMWMQSKVSNAAEEVKQLKERLAVETERADNYQQQTNRLRVEVSSLALELETAIASSTAEMNEARSRFEQELARIQEELYAEIQQLKANTEAEIQTATFSLQEKLTTAEMYVEEERKIRTSLENARIEAQSKVEKLERRIQAHVARSKAREDLLLKRVTLAEEQKQRLENELTELREEKTTRKVGTTGTVSSDILEEKDRIITELKRQLEEKNAVIQQQQELIEASAPDVDEDLDLDNISETGSLIVRPNASAPAPPAPAPPPPIPAPPPSAPSLQNEGPAAHGSQYQAMSSNATIASSLRDRLAGAKLKKVDHESIAREKEENDTSVFNFLARALIARRNAISEEAVDDEEW